MSSLSKNIQALICYRSAQLPLALLVSLTVSPSSYSKLLSPLSCSPPLSLYYSPSPSSFSPISIFQSRTCLSINQAINSSLLFLCSCNFLLRHRIFESSGKCSSFLDSFLYSFHCSALLRSISRIFCLP